MSPRTQFALVSIAMLFSFNLLSAEYSFGGKAFDLKGKLVLSESATGQQLTLNGDPQNNPLAFTFPAPIQTGQLLNVKVIETNYDEFCRLVSPVDFYINRDYFDIQVACFPVTFSEVRFNAKIGTKLTGITTGPIEVDVNQPIELYFSPKDFRQCHKNAKVFIDGTEEKDRISYPTCDLTVSSKRLQFDTAGRYTVRVELTSYSEGDYLPVPQASAGEIVIIVNGTTPAPSGANLPFSDSFD